VASDLNRPDESNLRITLRGIMDQAVSFVGLMTPAGILIDANRTALKAAGVNAEQVLGIPFWETPWWTHSPELQERLCEAVAKAAAGEEDAFQATHPTPDGNVIYVDFTLKPLFDDKGKVIYLIPEGRDVTAHMIAQLELSAANQRLEELASRLAMPETLERSKPTELPQEQFSLAEFSLADMVSCGNAIRSLLATLDEGQSYSDAVVRYLYDHIVDSEGKPAFCLIRTFLLHPYDSLTPKQQEKAIQIYPSLTANSPCLTLEATFGDETHWRDVADSKGHQVIPLPTNEAMLEMPMVAEMVRSLKFAPFDSGGENSAVDEHGVLHVNEAVGSKFIPAQEEFVKPYKVESVVGFGKTLPDQSMFAVLCFSRLPISRDVADMMSHIGQCVKIGLIAASDFANKAESLIASHRQLLSDHQRIVLQQNKRLQTAFAQLKQSNKDLEDFAYVASHDLKAPLRAISNLSDWVIEDAAEFLPEESQDHLEKIRQRVGRMERLLVDLLEYSRAGRKHGDLNHGVVADWILAASEMAAPPTGFDVSIEGGEFEMSTFTTPFRLCVRNFISNSVKHHDRDHGKIQVVCKRSARMLRVSITDDGPGIPREHHEVIFKMFQTLQRRDIVEGSGMGLALIKKIVNTYGGEVSVESNGRGATFHLDWPLLIPPELLD